MSDLRDIAIASNPDRADAILAWYAVSYESDTGDSLVLTYAEFDGPEVAGAHLDQAETGQECALVDTPLGDRSRWHLRMQRRAQARPWSLLEGGGIAEADQITRLARSSASRVY